MSQRLATYQSQDDRGVKLGCHGTNYWSWEFGTCDERQRVVFCLWRFVRIKRYTSRQRAVFCVRRGSPNWTETMVDRSSLIFKTMIKRYTSKQRVVFCVRRGSSTTGGTTTDYQSWDNQGVELGRHVTDCWCWKFGTLERGGRRGGVVFCVWGVRRQQAGHQPIVGARLVEGRS